MPTYKQTFPEYKDYLAQFHPNLRKGCHDPKNNVIVVPFSKLTTERLPVGPTEDQDAVTRVESWYGLKDADHDEYNLFKTVHAALSYFQGNVREVGVVFSANAWAVKLPN